VLGTNPSFLQSAVDSRVKNLRDWGIPLGRRFRALQRWMQIRWFGVDGMAARLREHMRLAGLFAAWVDADPDWERLAPVPFSTVCFRYRKGDDLDATNAAILDRVNASGRVFLSHTKLAGKYTLRVAIGNPRQTEEHVARCWALLREAAN
jgi:aromatic-L-amino-acid decarboxylase